MRLWKDCQRAHGDAESSGEAHAPSGCNVRLLCEEGVFLDPLKQTFREFTCMQIGEQFYRWKVLLFGLASEPKDFTFVRKRC